jgi:hypothetical protein
MAKYWSSEPPSRCDACDTPITNVFTDGKTTYGPWACMCPSCATLGPGIGKWGMGLGQEYTKQPDGKWLKTKG